MENYLYLFYYLLIFLLGCQSFSYQLPEFFRYEEDLPLEMSFVS